MWTWHFFFSPPYYLSAFSAYGRGTDAFIFSPIFRQRTLPSLLTGQEIYKLKRFFKEYDMEGEGEIRKDLSREVFKNWYLSLIHRREEEVPIWDWLGTEYVKIDNEEEHSLCQRFATVKWKDFVLNHALYILAARPNTGSTRPYVPQFNSLNLEFDEDDEDIEYD